MHTVDIQFAWLELYVFGRLLTFKKVVLDDFCQIGAKGVQLRRKAFRVHLSSIVLGRINRFTCLTELIQLIWTSISEVDVPDKNVSQYSRSYLGVTPNLAS